MSVTLLLIGITVAISLWAWNNPSLMERWIMNPYAVAKRGEYYRLLTSGFLHADVGHLFFNMLSFYFFGRNVEVIFAQLFGDLGGVVLVGFYLIAIVISDIPTLLKYKDSTGYNSLGASGGVAAVIFATILIFPMNQILVFFLPMPGFIFAFLYLAYSYYSARNGSSGINHDAHLYGSLFGLLFMAVAYPPAIPMFVEQVTQWRPL